MHVHVAIVGAGFSGTVLATHLLRTNREQRLSILLIERTAMVGRGVAYAARDWPYLLNVPAGRLSIDVRNPQQFLQFAQVSRPAVDAEDFLPRQLYGDYLQDELQKAEHACCHQTQLTRLGDEVVRIQQVASSTLQLHMASGTSVFANAVVLAVGNPAPGAVPWGSAVSNHAAFRSDPWTCPHELGADKSVVILGSGLTMIDVALALSRNPERVPSIISISRHGLTPLPQAKFHAAILDDRTAAALAGANKIRDVMGIIRDLADDVVAQGGDWRAVIAAVRNLAPSLWQRLPLPERRRFLRHVCRYWEVHRHRVPLELATRLESMRQAGKLTVIAGRILAIQTTGQRLRVSWRGRSQPSTHILDADLVVNAMGPEMSPTRSSDPLLKSLCESGWIVEDELALGLKVTANGACIGRDGVANKRLFYVGPMLRADYWEASAAAELRVHAERLATLLCGTPPSLYANQL